MLFGYQASDAVTTPFRSLKTLQKFSSVHAQVHNQFNQERHLVTRQVYKQRRSAALAELARPCRVGRPLREGVSRCAGRNRRYIDNATIHCERGLGRRVRFERI